MLGDGETMADTAVEQVLAQTNIDGLDIAEALARMGNSGKLYMRIIHSFVINMPENLTELATSSLSESTLADYAIKIHGAKGSCYGIGANKVGDIARTLEMAAKAGDLQTCLEINDLFVAGTEALIAELKALETRVEESENSLGGKSQVEKPDAQKLAALLAATKNFDIDQMNSLVEELASVEYARDGAVVDKIKRSFEAFDYQAVEEAITSYL